MLIKKFGLILVILTIYLFINLRVFSQEKEQIFKSSIKVSVIDENNIPIKNARVVVVIPFDENEFGNVPNLEKELSEYINLRIRAEKMFREGKVKSFVMNTNEEGYAFFEKILDRKVLLTQGLIKISISAENYVSVVKNLLEIKTSLDFVNEFEKGKISLELKLKKGGKSIINGHVTCEKKPLRSAIFRVLDLKESVSAECLSDDDGKFLLTGLEDGKYKIQVVERGITRDAEQIEIVSEKPIEKNIDLPLKGGVSVVMVGINGNPDVYFTIKVGNDYYKFPIGSGFSIGGLDFDKPVEITIEGIGLIKNLVFTPTVKNPELKIYDVLPSPTVKILKGKVVDKNGSALNNVQVQIKLVNASEEENDKKIRSSLFKPKDILSITDEQGRFIYRWLYSGRYEIHLHYKDFYQGEQIINITNESEMPLEVTAPYTELNKKLSGRVYVADESGEKKPAKNSYVFVTSSTKKEGKSEYIVRKILQTSEDGTFTADFLASLNYFILAGFEQRGEVLPDSLGDFQIYDLISNNEISNISVMFYPGPVIYGYLLDSNGNPLEGVEVFLDKTRIVKTQKTGLFVFTKVSFGEHVVSIIHNSETIEKKVNVIKTVNSYKIDF